MSQTLADKFLRLKTIMDELRERCPWDRKQTAETLRTLTIEETYELADAIATGQWSGIREELGDLLLHILFYARIGHEQGHFSLEDVIDSISEKLVKRHPHIYGDVSVSDADDVKRNWEQIKMNEGKSSVLEGVPRSLPALVKAVRIQEKAAQVGFEWQAAAQVLEKVKEEERELQQALAMRAASDSPVTRRHAEEEFGDLLFSWVNYSRFAGIDPELALERTNQKFSERFRQMEMLAQAQGRPLSGLSLAEMDAIWDSVKRAYHPAREGGML
ncbi:MAG: nucleoside triphosphate pyrophosphohydrolase [Bacteroidetes bacterium]|nr:nucleoside triphosphate pyrophosphohydrolase [Bacteroidota bacterium]